MPSPRLPDLTRMAVYLRDGGCCVFCGREVPFRQGQADHLTPRAWKKKNSDSFTNLAWTCKADNNRKGTMDLIAWADMVFRMKLRRVTARFASPAELVATVTASAIQPVNLRAAKAALDDEKA